MKPTTFVALTTLAALLALWAADPTQPKVGPTPVVNATNGYAGDLTVRTQLNVGYVGQQGIITISPPDTNLTATIKVDTNGVFTVTGQMPDGPTNVSFYFNAINSQTDNVVLQVGNAGAPDLQVGAAGEVYAGPNTLAFFEGTQPFRDDMFIAIHDASKGDSPGWESRFGATADGTTSTQAFASLGGTTNRSEWYNQVNLGGFVSSWTANVKDDPNVASADLSFQGVFRNFLTTVMRSTVPVDGSGLAYLWGTYNTLTNGIIEQTANGGNPVFNVYWDGEIESPNVFSLHGQALDGQTPYLFDTSIAHTSGNLVEVKNNGTLEGALGFHGQLFLGNQAQFEWSNKDFVIEHDVSTGDPVSLQTYWETIDSSNYNQNAGLYTYFDSTTNNVLSRAIWQAVDTGSNPRTRSVEIDAGASDLQLIMSAEGSTLVQFRPTVNGTTVAHILDTLSAHSSGDLMDFNNHGTNWVTMPVDLAATNAPLSLNINGTLKRVHVGAVDSGGTGLRALTVTN